MTTTNKGLETPAFNSYVNSWNTPMNSNSGLVDKCFGGVLPLNATGSVGTVALTFSDQQNLIFSIAGAMTGNAIYTLPLNSDLTSIVAGQWIVFNNTSGAFSVTIAPSTGGGTNVVIPQGNSKIIFSDGTNIRFADEDEEPTPIIPSGTRMLFHQTNAPTGWTKETGLNNRALRLVSGSVSSGGTTSFTDVFTSRTISLANMPVHDHPVVDPGHSHTTSIFGTNSGLTYAVGQRSTPFSPNVSSVETTGITVGNSGSGTPMDFAVQYTDVIIAQKD